MYMLEIQIDINPLVQSLSLSKEEVDSLGKMVLDKVGDAYKDKWIKQVTNNLKSTRNGYLTSMDSQYVDDFNLEFILSGKGDLGKLSMMIEEGASPFDIKKGMKNSPKAENPGKDNWYITIPFKQATPEALAESPIFAGKSTERVYEIAKENAGTPVTYEQLPQENREKGYRAKIQTGQTVIPKYDHKAPIFEGLMKSTKPKHEGYVTFRRISEKSDDNSWIHKGFSPHKFMEKALQDLEPELEGIENQAMNEFLDIKFGG